MMSWRSPLAAWLTFVVTLIFSNVSAQTEPEIFESKLGSGQVRVVEENAHEYRIDFRPQKTVDWKSVYQGPLKEFEIREHYFPQHEVHETEGTGGTLLKKLTKQVNAVSFFTPKGAPLIIAKDGRLISSESFPKKYERVRIYELNHEEPLLILSFSEPEAGTFLHRSSDGLSLRLAAEPLSEKALSNLEVNENDILSWGGERKIDLRALEIEQSFKPRRVQGVFDDRKKPVRVLDELDTLFEDFLWQTKDSRLPPHQEDERLVQGILETIQNREQRSSLLLGPSGIGKKNILANVVSRLPRTWRTYHITAADLLSGGGGLGEIEKRTKMMVEAAKQLPVVYVIESLHSLKGAGTHRHNPVDVVEQLRRLIASGQLVVLATDDQTSFNRAFNSTPGVLAAFSPLQMSEPRGDVLVDKLITWMESRDLESFRSEKMSEIIQLTADYDPGRAEPQRSIRFIEKLLTLIDAKNIQDVDSRLLANAAWDLYGVGPHEPRSFLEENESKRQLLKKIVTDQPQIVDAMMDAWSEINLGWGGKRHRTILITGPTGSGKTFSALTFADKVLNDPSRMLEIDATKYKEGGQSLGQLIGRDENTPGILAEFLNGRGRGRNVIVINEIEKAHPDLIQALMEMLDTGRLQAKDGRTYYLGRSLIVFTSNKGSDVIYPRGRGKLSRADQLARLESFTDQQIKDLFLRPDTKDLYDQSSVWGAAEVQRIDRAIAAMPPSEPGAIEILNQHAERLLDTLRNKKGIDIQLDESFAQSLITSFYVPEDGMRFVKQQTETILNRIHEKIITKEEPRPNQVKGYFEDREEKSGPTFVVTNEEDEELFVLEGLLKKPGVGNPLADPSEGSRLQDLSKRIKERVIGQESAVESTARSVRVRAVNPAIPTPGIQVFLGPTGIGKTELGKQLALALFGSKDRFRLFNLGDVKNEDDFNNIFGSNRGFKGSDKMPPFEEALNDYPEGMVLMFDEVGNMGVEKGAPGNGRSSSREDLLKKFYPLLDEGTWESPLGKVYKLGRHFIIFTSNEGEEVFQAYPTDSLRLSAWRDMNKKEKLHQLLRDKGWPEALLGRIGNNITMFKPLLEEERKEIARILVKGAIAPIESVQNLTSVQFEDRFFTRFAESFFSHSKGARSLRLVAESHLTDLIGKFVFEHLERPRRMREALLTLGISDNAQERVFLNDGESFERRVRFSLEAKWQDGEIKDYEIDVSEDAAEKRLAAKKTATSIAYHEAGHIVGNDPELTGKLPEFVTIMGAGSFGGYAQYRQMEPTPPVNRKAVIARIASLYAGQFAQELSGDDWEAGWMMDQQQARELAQKAVAEWGLIEDPFSLPTKDGKVIIDHSQTQDEIAKLLNEAKDRSYTILKERWAVIHELARRLLQEGYLKEEPLNVLLQQEEFSFALSPDASKEELAEARKRCRRELENLNP